MIEDIEEFYQKLADVILDGVPEDDWESALLQAECQPGSIGTMGEYKSISEGVPRSLMELGVGVKIFRELRNRFKEEGKPLWGRAFFYLEPSGKFKLDFSYENCDENGDIDISDDEWIEYHEAYGRHLSQPAIKK